MRIYCSWRSSWTSTIQPQQYAYFDGKKWARHIEYIVVRIYTRSEESGNDQDVVWTSVIPLSLRRASHDHLLLEQVIWLELHPLQ